MDRVALGTKIVGVKRACGCNCAGTALVGSAILGSVRRTYGALWPATCGTIDTATIADLVALISLAIGDMFLAWGASAVGAFGSREMVSAQTGTRFTTVLGGK